jgi:hypothetical protein
MADLAEQIGQFLGRRKAKVAAIVQQGGEREAALLKAYGAPSTLDAIVSGLEQGALHGFADDIERSGREDRTASSQIRAQAAHPGAYTAATVAGTAGAAGLLRGVGSLIGRFRSAGARASSGVSGGAGGSAWAAKNAERARAIEDKWAQFPLPGVKPQHRGTIIDAGHGAAWGYGGSDVQENEEALSGRRFFRALAGGGAAAVAAPIAASGAVAAGNAPLTFGGRRAFSKRMYEPPGVTRETPAGRPRESIDIARTLDESRARAEGTGRGRVARDTAPPLKSEGPNVHQQAERALAPVAADRIATAKAGQRAAAADVMEKAFPGRGGQRTPSTVKERRFKTNSGKEYVVEFDDKGGGATMVNFRRETGGSGLRKALTDERKSDGTASIGEAKEVLGKVQGAIRQDIDEGGRPFYAMIGSSPERSRIYSILAGRARDKLPEGYSVELHKGGASLRQQPDLVGKFVDDMMEAVVRRDTPAIQSWSSRVRAEARKNPEVMPRLRSAVARMLATQERSQPGLNDTPEVAAFLRVLGMGPSAKAARTGIIADARRGVEEQFPTQRYEQALERTAEDIPMRPRHADRMRDELENFTPPPYTGPADSRRGPPLIARGDDEPYWLNPLDFFREGRVNNAEVNAAGYISGPLAYGIETGGIGPVDRALFAEPEEDPIEGLFTEVAPRAQAQAQPQEQGLLADLRPEAQQAPAPAQRPAQAPPQAPPVAETGDAVRDIQRLLLSAGIDVGPEGDDGDLGPNTQRAIQTFARMSNMPGEPTPERVLARLKAYPLERLAEDLAAAGQ